MSLLTEIQQQAGARLAAQAFFADATKPVPVLTEQLGDLQNRVQQSLGQLGIVCVVLTPTAKATNRDRVRPYFDQISVVVRTQENVTLNRAATGTGQPASLVAEAAAWFLHGFIPAGIGGTLFLEEIRLVADPRLLVYETAFTLQTGLRNKPVRIAAAA